eukprot:TRINITY_DN2930_c0_g1_i2.p1 TRINITY_DN2930_c0_g1~~TRINITY_DN2930_c0_g1_i2.p1  ORF type:complete len:303 (-),score=108.09 TRINITY_DN2930_c0_g1_i2:664-1572(-)
MADEDVPIELGVFDPTRKKKKKKKVVEVESSESVEAVTEAVGNLSVAGEETVDAPFTGLKKKKKKPQAEGDAEVEALEAEEVNGEAKEEDEDDDVFDGEDEPELSLLGQKKKKKKAKGEFELVEDEEDEESDEDMPSTRLPWEGSDRDYTYEELLGRVFAILRENNPDLAGEKKKTIMKPPQVLREGTKKTIFVNFMDLCKTMHRQAEHVMAFLLAELGTTGSLDGQQRLICKGRFLPKVFEGVLRRYMTEYVMCVGCKSSDTILSKENRLFFLRCQQCGSSRSVAPIKAGFVARVGRRRAG